MFLWGKEDELHGEHEDDSCGPVCSGLVACVNVLCNTKGRICGQKGKGIDGGLAKGDWMDPIDWKTMGSSSHPYTSVLLRCR